MFSANSGNGMNNYRSVGVDTLATTAAPHKLVLMLFDGARAAIAQAKGQLARREVAAKGQSISQAISIIDGGLKASLDLKVGGEMAQNLSDLYVYMGQRLLHANLKNDAAALDEVATLLEQLGEAWRSIAAAPAVAASAAPAPMPPPQTYQAPARTQAPAPTQARAPRPETSGPALAYGAAAAFAPARTYAAAATSQDRVGAAPAASPSKAAATTPAGLSASPTPAGPSVQSRRLAAVYGRI